MKPLSFCVEMFLNGHRLIQRGPESPCVYHRSVVTSRRASRYQLLRKTILISFYYYWSKVYSHCGSPFLGYISFPLPLRCTNGDICIRLDMLTYHDSLDKLHYVLEERVQVT